ncbi:MAG: glycosyltransferase [Clostridia bacterium]|nr:glycosyltransferase [Clostridia bacterium]
MNDEKRVMIIGTVPYNKKSTSRAFDAYFHYFQKENIAQIFSNTKKPCKGHCGTLFQITDQRMLKRWLGKRIETGLIYNYDELEDEWNDTDLELDSGAAEKAYRIGRKHTPFTHLLRGVLWQKRFWCTEKLNKWLDEFGPECVFLAFSDDFFIPKIALYVAKRYNIPIVSCIGDDYYFNGEKTLDPFYHLYKHNYRKLIDRVFTWPGSAIYISDKIRDKYNAEFGLDGETVYLASSIERKPFRVINKQAPVITYFGNIRMGRNNSLVDIGYALQKISSDYCLEVYSNEQDERFIEVFKDNPGIVFCGSVPYAQVQKRMAESDITVIVEGFDKKDVNLSRYSLSTKAADALASGATILVYGSLESGIIDYMRSTGAAMVCNNKKNLVSSVKKLISDEELQKEFYGQAIVITEEHHNLRSSCTVSEGIIKKAISKMKSEDKKNE